MTSHGCYLCLLLFSVILIEPSEANCQNYFKKAGLNTAIHKLPENIPVKIMNKPEDIVVCSLMKYKDCKGKTEETCFLRDCFKDENNTDYEPPCNETDENISVPNLHFMCLTNIAKRLRDKTKPPEVCEVYKKVCGEDSATPVPPKPSPTTPTIEATPSTPLPTTPTGLPTTPTIKATPSTAPTIEAAPSTAPTIEATPSTPMPTTPMALPTTPTIKATPSTAPTIDATSSTAPTIEATPSTPLPTTPTALPTTPTIKATPSTAPTIEVTTKNSSTASTTETTTSSTTSTTAASFPVNSHQKSCSQEGICSEKETGSDIQKILIGVLITTNIIVPMAIYLYMRNQIQQQNKFARDVEEGSISLTMLKSSVIINSPENTII